MGNTVINSVQGGLDESGTQDESRGNIDPSNAVDKSKMGAWSSLLEPIQRTANSKIIKVVIDEHI